MRGLVLVFALGCGAGADDSGASTCPDPAPTWDGYGEGFFAENCVGCHGSAVTGAARNGAPDGVDFDDLAGVQAKWSGIGGLVEAGHVSGLSQAEIDGLLAYLECSDDAP